MLDNEKLKAFWESAEAGKQEKSIHAKRGKEQKLKYFFSQKTQNSLIRI